MTQAPRVSVIIPAYYSYGTVESCLQSLRDQSFKDFETILVNSSDEDITGDIVRTRFPEVIFKQSPTRLLPHAARNAGVSLARGELLVFTDPDCRARPDWLERLVKGHDAGHAVVGGSMELATDRWFERGVHLCKFSWLLRHLPAGPRWILPSANVSYGREVWNKIGPLDGHLFCGDAVLSWRAHAQGYSPWFEPQATVEHRHEGTLRTLWRERFGRGKEFAEARTQFEGWSPPRALAYVFLLPLLLLLVLLRAGRDASKSQWFWIYLATLPVQVVGQAGWCLGEAAVHWNIATCSRPQRRNSMRI